MQHVLINIPYLTNCQLFIDNRLLAFAFAHRVLVKRFLSVNAKTNFHSAIHHKLSILLFDWGTKISRQELMIHAAMRKPGSVNALDW